MGQAREERFSTWPWMVHQKAVKRMLFIIIIAVSWEPRRSGSPAHPPALASRGGCHGVEQDTGAQSCRKLARSEAHVPARQIPTGCHMGPKIFPATPQLLNRQRPAVKPAPRTDAELRECPVEIRLLGERAGAHTPVGGKSRGNMFVLCASIGNCLSCVLDAGAKHPASPC